MDNQNRMESAAEKKRVLIFIVAYNAERTIQRVIERIPSSLQPYDTHVLIIDDSSKDGTFQRAREFNRAPFPMTLWFNPVNQGYGGNNKIDFDYPVKEGFDIVRLGPGAGQN